MTDAAPFAVPDAWPAISGIARVDRRTKDLAKRLLPGEIAVIDHGRVIASGTAAELKAKVGGQTLDVRPTLPEDMAKVTAIVAAAVGSEPSPHVDDPGLLSVPVENSKVLPEVVRALQEWQIPVTELALRLASLDEVFLALTGHGAEEVHV